jgi:anti-sigma factor RsiW
MNITRDIVNDLLPAYLAGEASRDTRALVEELSAADPEIRELIESARHERTDVMLQPPLSLPPDLERDVVTRTRTVLRRRAWTLALALFCTGLPFSLAFHGNTITFLMARDEPGSRLLWLIAAWLWFDYLRQARRLHTKLQA